MCDMDYVEGDCLDLVIDGSYKYIAFLNLLRKMNIRVLVYQI